MSKIKPNRLMLLKKTVAVYFANQINHASKQCGKNARFVSVTAGAI
jgi:hypothetical protein